MAFRRLLRCKIHRATVTHADLHYEGSVTIPPDLMDAAGLVENEAVSIWNVTSGSRLETYALRGKEHSRDICINGAAAHLATPGDLVIIACFEYVEHEAVASHEPKLIFVDKDNNIQALRKEVPGPEQAPVLPC